MRIFKYLTICQLFYFSGCNLSETRNLLEIDINIDYDDLSMGVKLSEFSDYVQYIPLETSEGSLIGGNKKIDVTENHIVVRDGNSCFVFDKRNGKYIRKIGNKGRGPNEYESTRGFINPIKERVYFHRLKQDLLEFDIDGQLLSSIKLPADSLISPSQFTYIKDNFIGASDNVLGDLDQWVTIFNNTEIIQIHPNRNIHPQTMPHSIYLPQTNFYHYDDQLFFKEDYNDTVYLITENALSPYLVFNAGKYSLPYEAKWWSSEKIRKTQYIRAGRGFMKTEKYVIFYIWINHADMSLLGIYNKRTGQLQITKSETGIENDIDNFMSFVPDHIYNNELIGWIDAWKIEQWFKDNPDKAAKLPPHLKKLGSMTENDNPVVMIVRLKE